MGKLCEDQVKKIKKKKNVSNVSRFIQGGREKKSMCVTLLLARFVPIAVIVI